MADGERPTFVVIGGPNGAGKSTFVSRVGVGENVDPDAIAKRLDPTDPAAAAVRAAREAVKLLRSWKVEGRSFTYETTPASNASLKEIDDARAKGYEIRLYFIALDNAAQSAERVDYRVVRGGHDIQASKIVRRFELTFANAVEAALKVDRFELIDNHKGDFRSVLLIESGRAVARHASDSPRIEAAIARLLASLG